MQFIFIDCGSIPFDFFDVAAHVCLFVFKKFAAGTYVTDLSVNLNIEKSEIMYGYKKIALIV